MGYTELKNQGYHMFDTVDSLEGAALCFIRDDCEGLRFDSKRMAEKEEGITKTGTSLKENQIPFNMQMDIDRMCLENALRRFLSSGIKEDAFDVYFCYLEMFVGDYEKTRRMIELLSEFEANGSGLLMKHRDHYSHSVYVFVLGLAIYKSNTIYRDTYKAYYKLEDEHVAACHFLKYWGMASLFHDIGYPFELPFEQVASYFEVDGDKRVDRPFIAYRALASFVQIPAPVSEKLKERYGGVVFASTDELFAHSLFEKLSGVYSITEEQMLAFLKDKPTKPDKFNHFMDHAYFSATILFKKLFCEMKCPLEEGHMDALTAILMHNSLYKFCIAKYKNEGNIPLKPQMHPLAYMLMLCDELQCWDRTAYGRNSRMELHPMGCDFHLGGGCIDVVYLYDSKEIAKINCYKDAYIRWLTKEIEQKPKLKAYSGMFEKNAEGISEFQEDIERIVDLTEIKLKVDTGITTHVYAKNPGYLSNSNFINLYRFAVVLNGRWNNSAWKKAKETGQEEQFISEIDQVECFAKDFKNLSLEYKLSNINQAKAFARYLDAIGCFYSDQEVDFEILEHFTEEELLLIGKMEHQRWLQEHYDMGWEYGTPKKDERELQRKHKDMIPGFELCRQFITLEQATENYERLDKAEQDKDTEPMECMLAMLRMFDGLRIYRLH